MLRLFDSLAHPTLTGRWLGHSAPSDFAALSRALNDAGYLGACAVGIDGIEGYSHEAFIRSCRQYPNLTPIAGLNLIDDLAPEAMHSLRAMGFRGVKIHPRFARATRSLDTLGTAFRAASAAGLVVFYCTYVHCDLRNYPDQDPFLALVSLLRQAPDARVVLVHGGDVSLMRYAELVRFNPNLLLDLSLTLMKYRGSSVDLDLGFLFSHFDRRICIGTDWPEYQPEDVRKRVELFARDLSVDKQCNIGYRNLVRFLGIENDLADPS